MKHDRFFASLRMTAASLRMTLALAILLLAGQQAFAANTFSVTCSSSGTTATFTINRSGNTTAPETVLYLTVSLSAIEGQHFVATSGTLSFAAGETSKTVTVKEKTPTDDAYKYQTQSCRSYRFEVTDPGGFYLAHCDRDITNGLTSFSNAKVSSSITDLVKFNGGSLSSGMSSGKYIDVSYNTSSNSNHILNNGYFEVEDIYYYGNQTLCNVSTGSLISTTNANGSYLNAMGAKIYATVFFTMKEENDGYQYIQILTDNINSWDCSSNQTGESAGSLADPDISIYKALFEMDYNSNSGNTSDHKMFFPHKSNNNTSTTEFDYSGAYLYEQKYKSSSYRANNSGSLILDPTVETINVRFDCAGKDDDTFWVKDLKVRMALCDATAPTVLGDPVLAPGHFGYGNTVYVSVPFSEIVTVSGTPYLHTDWGDLEYLSGSGSNVLTFCGTINGSFDRELVVRELYGTITDLAGNSLASTDCYKKFPCTVTLPWGGSGLSAADPYVITRAVQLDYMATLVNATIGYNDFGGKYFVLDDDITYTYQFAWDHIYHLNGYAELPTENNYTAIGCYGNPFKGTFDGQGHTISGIRIRNTASSQGFIGYLGNGGTVKNVILKDAMICASADVGGIVGYNDGTVSDCIAYHVRVRVPSTSTDSGPIIGNNKRTVTRCYYRDCAAVLGGDMFVGNNRSDNVFDITTATGVSATPTSGESATIDDVTYYAAGSTFSLAYTGSIPTAYVLGGFSATSGTVNGDAASGYTFTLDASDAALSPVWTASGTAVALTLKQGVKDGITAWWGTFYDGTHRYTLPAGAAAYTMGNGYTLYRLGDDGRVIPENTAVVIISDSADIELVPSDSASEIAVHGPSNKNILHGSDTAVVLTGGKVTVDNARKTPYVLGVANSVFGFHQYTGAFLPAHRAWYVK